jgi:CheY-like chemotaxis protein
MGNILIVGRALPPQLEASLQEAAFKVCRAHSGEQALSSLRALHTDLVIVLADMMGLGVCHCIKSDAELRRTPVLLVGSNTPEISRGLEMGANDFLNFPTTELELFARVRSLIRFKLMQEEVRSSTSREAAQFAAIDQAAQGADRSAAKPKKVADLPDRSPRTNFWIGAIGFVIGASVSIGILVLIFSLINDGNTYSASSPPRALGILVLMAGIATARLFERQDFLAHFDRISFGMNRRLPLAAYGAWFLLWIGYLIASKADFIEWYDNNTQKFWLMLIIPPTAAIASWILFRWANVPQNR